MEDIKKGQEIHLNEEDEREFQRQFDILSFGTFEVTPIEDFKKMLRHSIASKKPLRVKCGIDPTGFDVHLGHTVPYRKMRQFQDLGHIGVVIIGDYTASIGDPTGKNESRPPLTADQVKENARRYMEQMYTVLDPKKTEVSYQSEWFEETSLRDILMWAGQTTVAKLLSHETFKDRLDNNHSLALNELFYPVLQGIDSVFINADVELGGSDQKFNVLMGRDYQRNADQRPQVAMLLPIITGTCGTQKMSKSLDNYIGILDEPFDKFGKIMSIPDSIMLEYYKYVGDLSEKEYNELKKDYEAGDLHPNEMKKQLATRVVNYFHGEEIGSLMREKFENVFKKKEVPDDVLEYSFTRGSAIVDILVASGVLSSKKEGRRLIDQNAIGFMDGEKIKEVGFFLNEDHVGRVLKIGKRKFLKLV